MKKLLFLIVSALISWSIPAQATDWTITPSVLDVKGHYVYLKILCTSNGSSLSATDIVPLMSLEDRKWVEKGMTAMVMNVDPGTGGVAPDATINVTFTDIAGIAVYAVTTLSNVTDTVGKDLSEDLSQFPVITSKFYLTLNDIGDSGDQVTLLLLCWVE
jgi:hypothetical protein